VLVRRHAEIKERGRARGNWRQTQQDRNSGNPFQNFAIGGRNRIVGWKSKKKAWARKENILYCFNVSVIKMYGTGSYPESKRGLSERGRNHVKTNNEQPECKKD